MIVDTDFPTHWKTQLLCGLLDDPNAGMYVIRMWGYCISRKTDRVPLEEPKVMAVVCGWYAGAEGPFIDALKTSRFVEETEDGWIAHELRQRNAKLFSNWENGANGGRPKRFDAEPTENPNGTHTKPVRLDKIKSDEKKRARKSASARRPLAGDLIHELDCTRWWADHSVAAPVILNEFERWMEVRLTLKAVKNWCGLFQGQLEALADLAAECGVDRALECVRSSRINQYQGLFPEKFRGGGQKKNAAPPGGGTKGKVLDEAASQELESRWES